MQATTCEQLVASAALETAAARLYGDGNTVDFKSGFAVLCGLPNAGKSTLLNKLLKEDRAIVSDIHGTTRDTIEDTVVINGVQFRFIDTAGIRQTEDKIEQIGIERTYMSIERAKIIIWIVDKTPSSFDIEDIKNRLKKTEIAI